MQSYLIANRFRATPLQQDIFDPAGAGHAEALRALQFRLRVFRPVGDTCGSFLWQQKKSQRQRHNTVCALLLYRLRVHPFKQSPLGLSAVGARERLRFHHILLKVAPCWFVRSPAEKQQKTLWSIRIWVRGCLTTAAKEEVRSIRADGHNLLVQIRWEARFYDWFGGK